MERPWKEIQDLVAYLERELADKDVIIKSPDWIWDHIAKEKREVDISIRKKIGNQEFLIIFEVRDWKTVQGITWIEQLITKKKNLHADHLIAVATTDFSKGARNVAGSEEIELRRISEITSDEIGLWLTLNEFTITIPEIIFHQTHFRLAPRS